MPLDGELIEGHFFLALATDETKNLCVTLRGESWSKRVRVIELISGCNKTKRGF